MTYLCSRFWLKWQSKLKIVSSAKLFKNTMDKSTFWRSEAGFESCKFAKNGVKNWVHFGSHFSWISVPFRRSFWVWKTLKIDAKIGMRFWRCGGEFVFLKGRGPAAGAEAMGPFLLVDFRGKSSEHAMHPQGGGGFKGFAPAAGPFVSWLRGGWKAASLQSCKRTWFGDALQVTKRHATRRHG